MIDLVYASKKMGVCVVSKRQNSQKLTKKLSYETCNTNRGMYKSLSPIVPNASGIEIVTLPRAPAKES
jgi:hypothetical protein